MGFDMLGLPRKGRPALAYSTHVVRNHWALKAREVREKALCSWLTGWIWTAGFCSDLRVKGCTCLYHTPSAGSRLLARRQHESMKAQVFETTFP